MRYSSDVQIKTLAEKTDKQAAGFIGRLIGEHRHSD